MSSGAAPSVYGRTARTDSGSHRQPGVYAVARRSGTRQRQPESQWRGRTAFARTPQESPDWEQAAQNWRIAGQYTYTASRTQRYLYALTAQDAL